MKGIWPGPFGDADDPRRFQDWSFAARRSGKKCADNKHPGPPTIPMTGPKKQGPGLGRASSPWLRQECRTPRPITAV